MLEIIILFFLIRNIGRLATLKGEPSLKWQLRGFLSWVIGEITGIFLVLHFLGGDYMMFAMLFGLGTAYLCFLLLKKALEERPDVEL